jgi:hypothetical protein
MQELAIQASAPVVIGRDVAPLLGESAHPGAMPWLRSVMWQCGATRVPAPMVTCDQQVTIERVLINALVAQPHIPPLFTVSSTPLADAGRHSPMSQPGRPAP